MAVGTTKSPSEHALPEVAARDLARELEGPPGALAFDGDGTLWSGDVGEDFFYGILASGRLHESAAAELARVAREHDVDANGSPAEIARKIYEAYLNGRFDEERVCEVMTWINAGWTHDATADFVTSIITDTFAKRIHPEVRVVLEAAHRLGHAVFVVSASPRPIVEAAALAAGIPRARVIAATAVFAGDRFAASVHRPIPYGAGKAAALTAALGETRLLAAFGDNAFDSEMLAMSERPIAVRPKMRLIQRAKEIPGIRQLGLE